MGEKHLPMTIRSVRQKPPLLLIAFEGCEDRNQASLFRNKILYGKSTETPLLPEGEYYHHQLVGLRVVSEDGQELGVLTEVLETGANDVYVVTDENGKEVLLPAIREVILGVDLAAKTMRVRPQTWQD